MSKGGGIDQGPGASSFEEPSKVGWLYKHGGSGVSSHWRKRWFVADHHYLFYYKGPNDKKPVGIVCLPDYESCHKAEVKVWKKQNAFMLDRGNTTTEQDTSEGAATKNYVLYADSEEEMKEWIEALTEEIKPMIGENRYANGFGGGKSSNSVKGGGGGGGGAKQKKRKGDQGTVAIDDKALDDVTALAGEGPKLTHLTASRPKMPRGRRLPKRYAVFHEDDSKPEESPPDTPDNLVKPTEALPPPSPSESPPTQKKKGQKPSAPLLPNFNRGTSVKITPKTPPIPPAKVLRSDTDLEMAEPESPSAVAQKTKFAKPPPPKKPVKEKPEVTSPEPMEPSASTRIQRPTPPVKPVKEGKETMAVERNENITPSTEDVTKVSPVKKPRPQPPIKPRAGSAVPMTTTATADNTTAAAAQVVESAPQPTRPMPAPRPVPRKRTMTPQASPVREQAKEPAIPEEPPASVDTEPEATPTVNQQEISSMDENKPVEPEVPEKETGPLNIPVKDQGILEIQAETKPQPEINDEGAAAEIHKEEEDTVLTNELEEKKVAKPPESEVESKEEEEQKLEPKKVKGEEEEGEEKSVNESGGDAYEIMDMGKKSEDSQEKELKRNNEYENISFDTLEAAAVKGEEKREKKEEEEEVSVATAEETKVRVTPKRVNQYDEVAGDWMPPKPRPKVNQYDEVAGDFLPQKSSTASTSSQDGVSPDEVVRLSQGYEHLEPAAAIPGMINGQGQQGLLDGDYVPMKDGVMIDHNRKEDSLEISQTSTDKSAGYEPVEEWLERAPPTKDLHKPLIAGAALYGDYIVQKSTETSPNHEQLTLLSPEKNGRQSVVSSSGSTSSLKSDSQLKVRSDELAAAVGSSSDEGRRRGSSSDSKRSREGSEVKLAQLNELERDSLGYTKVKQNGAGRVNPDTSEFDRRASEVPPEIIPMATPIEEAREMSASEALKQAKEVLRLAKVVKAEVEEMREEARKELSLANKDRRDAMILKKNAAEILRMAKERLVDSTK